jgi:hypothetical protein
MDIKTRLSVLAGRVRARVATGTESPVRFSCLAVLILFALVVVAFRPSYDTNDDVFMSMIVAGRGFCPAPDEHLIFTNVLIGQGLKSLYLQWPSAPWYGLYLLAVHYLSQVAILYCALSIGRTSGDANDAQSDADGPRRFGLYLQFTTTAFLATQAGLFLVFTAWRRRALQPAARVAGPFLLAVLLIFVGGMIRLDSQLMAILIAVPVAVFCVRGVTFSNAVPCGLALGTAAALVVGATIWDRAYYENDPQWQGFRSHNQLRGKFHDNAWTSYSPETAPVFESVGWTENDHAMIAGWYSDDAELYRTDRLQQILGARAWQAESRGARFSSRPFREMFRNRAVWAILLALPFVVVGLGPGRREKWAIFGSLAVAVALILFVAWSKKSPPARVYFPLLSFPLSVALLLPRRRTAADAHGARPTAIESSLAAKQPVARRRALASQIVTVMLIVGCAMGMHRQFRRSMIVERERRELREFLAQIPDQETRLYVCWAMPFELLPPWAFSDPLREMPLAPLAWMQGTPWFEEIKRRHDISHIVKAVSERPDIQLIATPEERALFARFAQEHFGVELEFVPGDKVGQKVVAGYFRPAAPSSERPVTASRPLRSE